MSSLPPLTVISPVYNKSDCLRRSVESILQQTHKDFIYLIIDDGSTDTSLALLKEFTDPRIILLSQTNRGVTATLREHLATVRTPYIAIHDTGDVSYPDRLRRQIEFLEANPQCAAVGTAHDLANAAGEVRGSSVFHTFPILSTAHLLELTPYTCYCHGSVMMRTAHYHASGGYQLGLDYCQDKDLWLRLAGVGTLDVIRDVLHCRVYDLGSESLDGYRRGLQALYSEFINELARQRVATGSDELETNPNAFEEFLSRLTFKDRRRIARSIIGGYRHSTVGCPWRLKYRYLSRAVRTPHVQAETSLAVVAACLGDGLSLCAKPLLQAKKTALPRMRRRVRALQQRLRR